MALAFLFVSILSVRASLENDWFGKFIRVVGPNYDVCFGEDQAGIAWMKRPSFLLFGIIKMELEVDAFKPSLFVYGHFT